VFGNASIPDRLSDTVPTSPSLDGSVVAITGAGRGIGKATATELAERGARVVIGDLDFSHAERAASAINHTVTPSSGGVAIALRLDVRDRLSFRRFLDEAGRDFGPLDVLVNNAGIMPVGPFLDEDEPSARAAFEINVGGTMSGMKLALPGMLERGSGHIVNVACYAGLLPAPGQITYAATKSAVLALTDGARWEFQRSGVAFTAIVPSFTRTELVAGTRAPRSASLHPEAVAAAIADAIASRARTVYVPGRARSIGSALSMLPSPVRRRIHRALGTDSAFLDLDRGERRGYEQRIRQTTDSDRTEPPTG